MKCIYVKQTGLYLFLLSLLLFFCARCFAETQKKLFIVNSYERNHVCGQPQNDGAIKALEDSGWKPGKNLDIVDYYMDTKQKNNTPELIRQQADKVLKKIKVFQPDVILLFDDNAFRTVALPLQVAIGKKQDTRNKIQETRNKGQETRDKRQETRCKGQDTKSKIGIVFSGMNVQPEVYNKIIHFMDNREHPGGNITGVYEKLHIREAIKVFSKLINLKKILLLDDLSPTGKAIAEQVKLELYSSHSKDALPCKIERKTIKCWEEYKKVIHTINTDSEISAFYPGALLLKDSSGKTYTARDIIAYTIKHAKKPGIAMNYAFAKMGLLGGASVDFFAMGYQAGQKVAAILNGADPGSLPIDVAQRVALIFNLSRAKALGIKIPGDILLAADEVFKK